VDALGTAVIAYALFRVLSSKSGFEWLILAALTVLTAAFTLSIPGVNANISLADTLVFINLILFGPAPATITAALGGFVSSIRSTTEPRRMRAIPFNMAVMSLSACIAGEVFFGLLGRGPIYHGPAVSLRQILAPMGGLVLIYYLFNSGAIAIISALELRQSPYRLWRENYLWTLLTCFTESSVAVLIAINISTITPAVLGIIAPMLLVTYFTYKTYLNKIKEQVRHLQELRDLHLRTVESLALAADAKDQTTYGHIRRVRAYAVGLAKLSGISDPQELLIIDIGSLLHDIGKLAVDDYILSKPGTLSAEEFEKMKTHTTAGEEILEQIRFPFPAAKCVRAHHERWDGGGYPDGLKEEEIPVGARILAIADTFDAFRSSRPYKLSHTREEAIELLKSESGKAFDPHFLDLFLRNLDQLEASAEEATNNMPKLSFRKLLIEHAQTDADILTPIHSHPTTIIEELTSFYEFCFSFAKYLELPDLLANVEMRLRRLLPFTTCAFFLDNGDDSVRAAHVGGKFSELLKGHRIEMGKGISGWVAAYQKPVINTNAELDFQGRNHDFTCLVDVLAVPVVSEDRGIGSITLYAERPISYSPSHLEFLQLVAQPLGGILAAHNKGAASTARDILDPVTGTYQAAFLPLAGSQMIAAADKSHLPFSLFYLRLDNFVRVVSTCPQSTADMLFRAAADSLHAELRDTDVLIRFGQEGFLALLVGVSGDCTLRRARRMRQQVRTALAQVRQQPLSITCQVGVATYPSDGATIWDLLLCAQRQTTRSDGRVRKASDQNERNVVDFTRRP
jgi:diguanylate cyclase (GGDEF)-like protein